MKHDGPSSVGDDIPAHDAFAAMLGIETKLGQLSEQLTRIANRDRNTLRHAERSPHPAPDRSFANIRASVEVSERRAAETPGQFGDRRDAPSGKYSNGFDGFLRNVETRHGERVPETAVQKHSDLIEVNEGRPDDTLKGESPINAASWSTVSIAGARPLTPALTRLENHVADLTNRLSGHEAAQEDLRRLVQSGLGRLDQRIDTTKLASEAAAQRTQNQAARQAQEELRKLAQSEFGRLGQRMDMLKQIAEAAAQRAQNQAVQQAQKGLRDLEDRMQTLVAKGQPSAPAPESGEMARLRDEMESLGQRVDDLTVKSASEHDLGLLRDAIEQLSVRVAQGPDPKPLAELDRRLTEITGKLEQNRGNPAGSQIDAADIDRRIAAAMRQNQISPPWTVIERKLAGFSDRLAHTEWHVEHIATLEKWIIQLYKNLEETLDWTRNVAEDAADRMASRLMEEWPSETSPVTATAEFEALQNALAAMRTDHEDADQRNQKALGTVNEALEQIVGKLSELEQLRDQLQDAAPDEAPAETALVESGMEPVLATAVQASQMPMHPIAGPADYKRRFDGARHDAGLRLSLRLRKRETFFTPAGAPAHAPAAREGAHSGMRGWLLGLVVLAAASAPVTLLAIERTKPFAALSQFTTDLGSNVLSSLFPEASNADAGGSVIAETEGLPSGTGPANCQQTAFHRGGKATCREMSQVMYPR